VPTNARELLVLACATTLAIGLFGGFETGPAGPKLSPARASWKLTPGVANHDVTQETIAETICKRGWTATIRPPTSYTDELKLEQMTAYHRLGAVSDYQEDHLISLELGGDPQDPRNLWPEPIERARAVDDAENELNAKICSGEITLAEGQRRISELKHTAG
jgi:hypothetical protein